ncbi:hypothetical protein RJ639_041539 [Escallonia herrerae]|uniref:CS domain-containing protein n=1 Tax=Escallonia herrerae TaxID=1293975 RepID=A0AA88WGH6_9ASTE|nr:hypothetical protein RJ639_041539 [Escallonia herrerae]
MQFSDGSSEMELRLKLGDRDIPSTRDISVEAEESSLAVRIKHSGSPMTLMETSCLYEKIKPAETIWSLEKKSFVNLLHENLSLLFSPNLIVFPRYLDEDELVVNLKKQDPDLKWPDIVDSWESLTVGVMQLLKGTSLYLVGDSTEINQKISRELAVGLGYVFSFGSRRVSLFDSSGCQDTPLSTKELLEACAKETIDSWVIADGSDAVAEAEGAILESLSSHVRSVVATLGGQHGAAGRANNWQHLYAGFTVWLSQSEAKGDIFDLMFLIPV